METANSIGEIVSGSKVYIDGDNTKVYDVGEVYNRMAKLYIDNTYIVTISIDNLIAL